MSDNKKWLFAVGILVIWIAILLQLLHAPPNPCTENAGNCYSIQGLTSMLDCPGQHAWTVTSAGHEFFMGCR